MKNTDYNKFIGFFKKTCQLWRYTIQTEDLSCVTSALDNTH